MQEKIDKFFEKKKQEAGLSPSEKKNEESNNDIERFFKRKKAETNLKSNGYEI